MKNTFSFSSPQRLQIKIYTKQGRIENNALIDQFHSWIQNDLLDEIQIDVADYSHVVDGPGILLITHEADYAFDNVGGPGLRYVRKKHLPEQVDQAILQSYKQVLKAAKRLESEAGDAFSFDVSSVEITFLDRRLYPNTSETASTVIQSLLGVLAPLYGNVEKSPVRLSEDSRYPFALRISTPDELSLDHSWLH